MPFFGVPIRNGLPIGLGSVAGFGVQQFDPSQLFAGGTVAGAWYDPSDLSTLFTTSAGTTQCAMPGQGSAVSVGLMLDKSQGLQRFWSGYFDATGDYLSTASSAGIAFGTGDFTIEGWCYSFDVSSGTQRGIFQTSDTAGGLKTSYLTGVSVNFGGAGAGSLSAQVGGVFYSSAGSLVRASTWFHFAVTRQSGTVNLWVNGVSVASGAGNTQDLFGQFAAIGGYYGTGFLLNGYVSNFRIVKGAALYTGTFTPPSPVTGLTAISGTSLLTCQNSTFIDNSGNSIAITVNGGAVTSQNIPLGNHAIAFNNTTARPELRARVNLLTYSEEFNNVAWVKVGGAVSANTTVAPDGTTTADTFTASNTYLRHAVLSNAGTGIAIVANTSVVFSAYIQKGNYNFVSMLVTNNITTWFVATFDFSGATPVVSKTGNGAGGTFTSASVEAANNGFWRLTIRGSTTDAAVIGEIALNSSATPTYGNYGEELWTAAGTETVIAWGADLRPANIGANVPAYQRIADANTYDTSGFPLYLFFDGADDSMYTPANLNLSGTDKVAVFAGVRKLSDAIQVYTELSADYNANNGTFLLWSNSSPNSLYFDSKGTAIRSAQDPATAAAPASFVLTGQGNISAPSVTLRKNGTQVASNTSSQGTGNYGSYPLFVGSRNNASFLSVANIYSLIIAGSAVSAGNISATEQWVAGKVGIVIP